MSDGDLPDLPPDIASLLHDARDTPVPPPAERRKVAARLALTTGLAIPGASLAGAKLLASAWTARAVGLAVALTALGGVAVGTLRPPPAHRRPRAAVTARAPAAPAPSLAPATTTAPTPAIPPTPPAPAPPPTPAPAPALARTAPAPAPPHRVAARVIDDETLDAELALLAEAHAALSRGDAAAATAALARHGRQHPRGRLSPEREALRVECLAAGGDRAAAEAARQSFHRRFPDSVLGGAVDRAVGAAP